MMTPAPAHLRPATRRWFRSVQATFDLAEHHVRLLTAAAEAWDRAQEAREAIAKHGAFYQDRSGAPKAHPAVNVERDAKVLFARLLRELRLDLEPPRESRPPDLAER